jgi:glyoxylase-like metal-dependent hydrolase (beta-lactamase superfamily II)
MDGAPLEERAIGARVVVFTPGGDTLRDSFGANCTAVIGDQGVLLIDPLIAPAEAARVEAALRRRTSAPVRFVALTHHHTDHALGAGLFARRGVPVLAHHACCAAMAAEHPALVAARRRDRALGPLFAGAEPFVPESFESHRALELGGTRAVLRHFGPGHTAGDVVVEVPDERLVVCGDLVNHRYHTNFEDADLPQLEARLSALRALGCAHVVPGHGAPGGPELIEGQRSYQHDFRVLAREAASLDAPEASARVRARFPGYRLEIVVPESLRRLAG